MRWRLYRRTTSQKPSNFRNLLHFLFDDKLFFTKLALMMIALKRMHDPFNMNKRCSLTQIAEALILSTMDYDWNDYLVDHLNPGYFKSLDTFMTTVYQFAQVFDWKFRGMIDKYLDSVNWASEEEFLNFLAPRCETLSQKRDHFGLIFTCSFACETLRLFRRNFECLHYDSAAYKYLLGFFETSFKCLEDKSYWNSLIHYCKEINKTICNRRFHRKHLPAEKPASPVSSGDDVGNETDESNRKCESDTIETAINNKLECPDINTEKLRNLSVHFNDKTNKRCDQSIETNQPKITSDVSQNKIEKNKTEENKENYIESNIAVNTTSVSNSEVTGNETTDERNRRKLKSDTIETGIINKLVCPDIDTEEVMNLNEHINGNTDKICDETLAITPSEVMSDVSQNGEIEQNKPQEIEDNVTENIVCSSPIKEIESWYDTTSSEDSFDEHASARHAYYNLLMPDRPYKLEMLGLLKKCESAFDNSFPNRFNNEQPEKGISSSSTTKREESDKSFESKINVDVLIDSREKIQTPVDEQKPDTTSDAEKKGPEVCKDCKGKNFELHFQESKMAFKKRYNNLNKVSDCFY